MRVELNADIEQARATQHKDLGQPRVRPCDPHLDLERRERPGHTSHGHTDRDREMAQEMQLIP